MSTKPAYTYVRHKDRYGKVVPSVTTIIGSNVGWGKEFLLKWANDEGLAGRNYKESRQKAADTGTLAHTMVEDHIHNRTHLTPPGTPIEQKMAAANAFDAFYDWFVTNDIQIERTEIAIVSEKLKTNFGGRIDAKGTFNGLHTIFDWKTSKAVYENYVLQVAAYAYLYEELHGIEIDQAIIVRIGKDAEFQTVTLSRWVYDPETGEKMLNENGVPLPGPLVQGWTAFRAALHLHEVQPILRKLTYTPKKKAPTE